MPSSSICMLVPRCSSMDMVDTGRDVLLFLGWPRTTDREVHSVSDGICLHPTRALGGVRLSCHGCKLGYDYVGYVPRPRGEGSGHDFGSTPSSRLARESFACRVLALGLRRDFCDSGVTVAFYLIVCVPKLSSRPLTAYHSAEGLFSRHPPFLVICAMRCWVCPLIE